MYHLPIEIFFKMEESIFRRREVKETPREYIEWEVLHNLVDPWLRASNRIQFFRRLTGRRGYKNTAQLHPVKKTGLSSSPLLPKRLAIFIPLSSLLRATTRDGHSADLADNGGAEVSTTPRGRRTTIIIPDNPKRQFLPPKRRIGTLLFLIQPTFDGQSSLRLDRIPLFTILKKVGV